MRQKRCWGFLLAIGLWDPAIASWTDPLPASHVAFQVGCGADSGLAIQILDLGSKSFYLRSSTGRLFDRSRTIAPLSVGTQVSIQVFSFQSQTPSEFRVVDDKGECSTGSAIEMLGVAVDRAKTTSSVRAKTAVPSGYKRLSATRIELASNRDWSLRDPAGTAVSVASSTTPDGILVDISALPRGTYFLRSGSQTSPFVKF